MSETDNAYRIATLPGHGRLQVPAGMTDAEVLAGLAAPEPSEDPPARAAGKPRR